MAEGALTNVASGAIGSAADGMARGKTANSTKQKYLNRQADRANRLGGPHARKYRQEAAKKANAAAKQNLDNSEVVGSNVVATAFNEDFSASKNIYLNPKSKQ